MGFPAPGLDLPIRRRWPQGPEWQRSQKDDRRRCDVDGPERKDRQGTSPQTWGRLAIAIAPAKPDVVYVFIEAEAPRNGLYRSEDGGRTWAALDRSQNMIWRPFYFANLI